MKTDIDRLHNEEMKTKVLCWFGFHDWLYGHKWDLRVATFAFVKACRRCKKIQKQQFQFDLPLDKENSCL